MSYRGGGGVGRRLRGPRRLPVPSNQMRRADRHAFRGWKIGLPLTGGTLHPLPLRLLAFLQPMQNQRME